MRILGLVLLILLCVVPLYGQTTSVSGTFTDASGQSWNFGNVTFTFRPANSNPTGPYFQNGVPFNISTTVGPITLDGTGSFAGLAVPDNNTISPSQSQFAVKVCPASTTSCVTANLTITGATQNISASIVPPAIVLNLSLPLAGASAYRDTEVTGANPGTLYFNITDNRIHVCIQTGFPPCTWFVLNGGGGTVTSVSSGNFSPLFNVTVATPTTTPAFSFTALNAAAGTIFGNPGGAPAPASFNAPSAFSGIGTVTNIATTSPITGGPITTTGTIACPTCVISVSGTANQITSSGGTTPVLSIPATFIAPGSIQATTSLTGTSVTDSGLTNGRCVQAGVGGLLGNAAGACTSGAAIVSFGSLGGNSCSPGVNSFDTCTSVITISPAQSGTSYAPVCNGISPTNPRLLIEWSAATSTTTITATVISEGSTGGTEHFTDVRCIAVGN